MHPPTHTHGNYHRLVASPSAPPLAALAAPWLLLACHWVGGMALLLEVDGCGDLTDAAALAGFGVAAEPHFDRVWLVRGGGCQAGCLKC